MALTPDSADKNALLHQAVRENRAEIAEKYLSEGACVNSKDKNSNTCLHIAVENGDIITINVLLKFNADVFAKDKYGRTVLDSAFWNDDEQIILALLNKCSEINFSTNNRGDTPLHLAVELSSPKLVEYVLKRGALVNTKKYRDTTALHLASWRGDTSIVTSLLERGADFNCKNVDGETPLLIAAKYGKGEVVALLLNYAIDVNIRIRRGETALHLLIENKVSEKVIRLLLTKGAEVNVGTIINRTPLHICAICGQTETAKTLLEFGANPDCRDSNDQTPLHLACMQGNGGVVQVLLSYSADVNANNELCKTPLHYAVLHGSRKIMKLLLDAGADPNAKNLDGKTPLAYSVCGSQDGELINLLLQFGAEINSMDRFRQTPLHLACRSANKDIVLLLLDLGSDVNAKDWENRTPLESALCSSERYQGVLNILEYHIVMRETAGLYVCEENLNSLNYDEELQCFETICRNEVDDMKKTRIGKTNVSYHDILTKSIRQLVKIARNPEVVEGMKDVNYDLQFPLYVNIIAPIIRKNFSKALKRQDLLDRGAVSFDVVFDKFPKLPQHCIDEIFFHLRNRDIRNLISTCGNEVNKTPVE